MNFAGPSEIKRADLESRTCFGESDVGRERTSYGGVIQDYFHCLSNDASWMPVGGQIEINNEQVTDAIAARPRRG